MLLIKRNVVGRGNIVLGIFWNYDECERDEICFKGGMNKMIKDLNMQELRELLLMVIKENECLIIENEDLKKTLRKLDV